jgi:hypothetical protein
MANVNPKKFKYNFITTKKKFKYLDIIEFLAE